MPANEQQSPYTAFSQLAVVILLAASALLLPPLVSERPPPSGQGAAVRGAQNVDARLWQDPVGAVQSAAKKLEETAKSRRIDCLSQGARPNPQGQIVFADGKPCELTSARALPLLGNAIDQRSEPITVIYALVPGGAWVGADEMRRRQRYALLAALSAEDYAPDDPEHLGFVETTLHGAHLTLPFEWFSQRQRAALLLWVDEESLSLDISANIDGPCLAQTARAGALARLACLHEAIVKLAPDKAITPIILGPTSSAFLNKVAEEICNSPAQHPALEILHGIPWYSPQATLPDEQIAVRCGGREGKIADALPNFFRMTPTDDQLSDALLRELKERGVNKDSTVVLVSQWDTAYSRYLEHQLRSRFANEFGPDRVTVVSASYLRGLDGLLPGASANKTAKAQGSSNKEKTTAELERPEGEAQIDYLRRLAGQLHRQRQTHGPVAAVGVLGNDYHDKLLVLTALRPAFPEAVFFTTDLDAAMLHPHDNQYTRNLVVAAPFGLNTEIDDSPPFRDNYQTANYLAARVALGQLEHRGPAVPEYRSWLQPQVFEIGRVSALPLALPDTGKRRCEAPRTLDPAAAIRCDNIFASPVAAPGLYSLLLVLGPVLLIAVLGAGSGHLRREAVVSFCCLCLLTALLCIGLSWATRQPVAEPFSWIEGVSVWPSEIVRFIAFVLSIGLLFRARAQLAATVVVVERRFGLGIHDDTSRSSRQPDVREIWRHYRRPRDNPDLPGMLRWPAPGRIALLIGVLIFSVWLVSKALGFATPTAPLRGSAAAVADKVILYPTVIAFQVLLFFVLDQVWQAIWLARQLNGRSLWPDQSLLSHLRDAGHTARKYWQRFLPKPKPGQPPSPARAPHVYDDWLDCQLIAAATVPVQNMIFYPFAIIALLILARSSLFDRWTLPPLLLLVFGVSLLLVVIAAVMLRNTAEGVRSEALRWLNTHLVDARGRSDGALAAQLEYMVRQVHELRVGAFAPVSQQPLFRAAITVFGSISGIKLLEYMSIANV